MASGPRRVTRGLLARGLLIGVAAGFLALAFWNVFALERLEHHNFDRRLRWRGARAIPDSGVVLIAIDSKTVGPGKFRWPLPRAEYDALLRFLKNAGARCVGFDVRFEGEDQPEQDRKLAQALAHAGNVYLGIRFDTFENRIDLDRAAPESRAALARALICVNPPGSEKTQIRMKGAELPPAVVAPPAPALGTLTEKPELDGVVRRFPLVAPYTPPASRGETRLYASLPLLMAADMLGVPLKDVRVRLGDAIEIGPRRIPINESGEMVINYYGGYRTLYYYSFSDVVSGVYPAQFFRDKAVVLGVTVPTAFDIHVSPHGGQYPGVEAQVTVLHNLLDGSAIRIPDRWLGLLLVFGAALLVGASRVRRLASQATTTGAVLLAIIVMGYWLLAAHGVWMEVVKPSLAALFAFAGTSLSTFRAAERERGRVEGAVAALAEVTPAIAHTHRPADLGRELEAGIARVLGESSVALRIHDEWLREHLPLASAPAAVATGLEEVHPVLLHGEEIGHLLLPPGGRAADPALLAAVSVFAALLLENAALSEERRADFLNMTITFAQVIESKDRYTAGHCTRVMEIACTLAERVGLPPREIELLRYAAVLHDIGKLVIPDQVLNKPGALTAEEMTEMRRHPALARQWLHHDPRLRGISETIASHHEWWNGGGYPDGLAEEQIPLGGRILAVADVWDALITDRPYRNALSFEEARQIIVRGRGKQFDPQMADLFLAYIEEGRSSGVME